MLVGNVHGIRSPGRHYSAVRTPISFGLHTAPLARFTGSINKKSAIPDGYTHDFVYFPMTAGAIRALITADSSVDAPISAPGNMEMSTTGTGTVSSANLAKGRNLESSINGVGALTAPLYPPARMSCTVSIGAQPSAFDIAQAVWEESLTGHATEGTSGAKMKALLTLAQFLGLK